MGDRSKMREGRASHLVRNYSDVLVFPGQGPDLHTLLLEWAADRPGIKVGLGMYDLYPERWTGDDDHRSQSVAERPRRRPRRAHPTQPEIIRVREEHRSADR